MNCQIEMCKSCADETCPVKIASKRIGETFDFCNVMGKEIDELVSCVCTSVDKLVGPKYMAGVFIISEVIREYLFKLSSQVSDDEISAVSVALARMVDLNTSEYIEVEGPASNMEVH
jgi:hypothetical protein